MLRNRIYSARDNIYYSCGLSTVRNSLKSRFPYLKRIVRRHFPKNLDATIIDLGCGYGALIYVARKMGYLQMRGADLSQTQIEHSIKLGIDGIQKANAMDVLRDIPDNAIDCIVCFDLLEHLSKGELGPFVDEVHRVLKHGGRWIIHVPNAESPFGMKIRYGDITHELAFTRASIRQLLISSGFPNVECFEDEPIAHGAISLLRLLAWKILRLLYRFIVAIESGDLGRNSIFSQSLLAIAKK